MSAVYPKAKEAMLSGLADLSGGTVRAALVDAGTVVYNAAHQFFSDISAGVVGTPVALTGKSITNGVFDADDVVFATVTGATVEAVVLYLWTGTAGTSRLLFWIDTAVTPDGTNVTVAWPNDTTRIFRIAG